MNTEVSQAVDVEGQTDEPGEKTSASAAPIQAAPSRSSCSPRWRIACATLTVVLIAAIAGCAVLWRDRAELEDRADAQTSATDAAERIVAAWLTYDYRTYRDDMTWVTESGTEAFQKEYSPEALEGLRKRMVGPRQLVSRGRAVQAAATAVDADRVRVLVFTDQTLTDKVIRREGGEALHARSGVELTMVRDGDDWLVDEMVQLQFQ